MLQRKTTLTTDEVEPPEEIIALAEKFQRQPYHFFGRNCLHKSWDFVQECRRRGVRAKMVICLGIVYPQLVRWRFPFLGIHSWGEVAGQRLEVSHHPGETGVLGIRIEEIRPLLKFRLI